MSKTIREELKDMYKAKGGQQADLTNDSQTIAGMVAAINRYEKASKVLSPLTVESAAADFEIDDQHTLVSSIQEDVTVTGNQITGRLLEQLEGPHVDYWGPGYFIVLHLDDIDSDATSVLCGMDPSQESGLVEIINDPDKVGLFKVTYKDSQIFKVIQSDGTVKLSQAFSLSGLTLVPADEEE